jgi:6,7-dimethyl-8-ribityllumazine synthase
MEGTRRMRVLRKINEVVGNMSQESFNTMMNVILLTVLAVLFVVSTPKAIDQMLAKYGNSPQKIQTLQQQSQQKYFAEK